jgi:hypothetical protein
MCEKHGDHAPDDGMDDQASQQQLLRSCPGRHDPAHPQLPSEIRTQLPISPLFIPRHQDAHPTNPEARLDPSVERLFDGPSSDVVDIS